MKEPTAVELWGDPSLGIPVTLDQGDIHIYGMKRSGVHPISNWILHHFRQQTVLYRNCRVFGQRVSCRWSHQVWRNYSEPLECRILTFLDQPEDIVPDNNLLTISKSIPSPKLRILVLRDPFNLFASRIKAKNGNLLLNSESWSNHLDLNLWKTYACEFIGRTNYLGNCLCINYNRWFSDVEYRRKLSVNFGDFTDSGFGEVPEPGSSFDFYAYRGQAQQQPVLSRWKTMWKNEDYQDTVLKDSELSELSNEIFGLKPPKMVI